MAQTMGREVAFGFLVSNTAMEFRTITLFAVFFVSNYVVANRISLLVNVLQEYNLPAIKSTSGQYCEEEYYLNSSTIALLYYILILNFFFLIVKANYTRQNFYSIAFVG